MAQKMHTLTDGERLKKSQEGKMKKEFLTALGIDEENASKIMTENGKDIEREKGKFADYEDLKNQIKTANEKIASFGDVEAVKAEVAKYKAEAEKAQSEATQKIALMERQAQIKDFTGSKKFVNDITKEAINAKLLDVLGKEESKGKSLDELFKTITEGKENVLVDDNGPKPPVQSKMADTSTKTDDSRIRAIMGLPEKK